MTHRQYLGWVEWLQECWNRPSREDWYQMQTAAVAAQSKKPLSDFKIKFEEPNSGDGLTDEMVEAVWMARIYSGRGNREDDRATDG